MKNHRILLCILWLTLLQSCGPPDLADPQILNKARKEAIPLESLKRELKYDILMLYLDQDGEPFTGWVREDFESKKIKSIGYLLKGQKTGLWIDWHENGERKLETHWKKDSLEGKFLSWHPDGNPHVIGQTHDGEVDGEWMEYYSNGQLMAESINTVGKLVSIQVWLPDGTPCRASKVKQGNGSFNRYEANGSLLRRTFLDGVETKREWSFWK